MIPRRVDLFSFSTCCHISAPESEAVNNAVLKKAELWRNESEKSDFVACVSEGSSLTSGSRGVKQV